MPGPQAVTGTILLILHKAPGKGALLGLPSRGEVEKEGEAGSD